MRFTGHETVSIGNPVRGNEALITVLGGGGGYHIKQTGCSLENLKRTPRGAKIMSCGCGLKCFSPQRMTIPRTTYLCPVLNPQKVQQAPLLFLYGSPPWDQHLPPGINTLLGIHDYKNVFQITVYKMNKCLLLFNMCLLIQGHKAVIVCGSRAHLQDEAVAQVRRGV